MLVDLTNLDVEIDPDMYPTGLVLRVMVRNEEGGIQVRSPGDRTTLDSPDSKTTWDLNGESLEIRLYSLTEYNEIRDPLLGELELAMITATSTYLCRMNSFEVRKVAINIGRRHNGWWLEIGDDEPGRENTSTFAQRMPEFVPFSKDILEEKSPLELLPAPSGKPLWQRILADD